MSRPKKENPKSNTVFLRLDDNTYRQLQDLCTAYGVTPQQYIIADIQQAYDKFNGSPLLKHMLGELNSLASQLKEQTKQTINEEQPKP